MRPSKSDKDASGEGSLQSQMQMQPTRNQKYISTERAGNYSPIRVAGFSVCMTSVPLQDSRASVFGWKWVEPRLLQSPCPSLHDTHELQLIDAFKKHMPVYVRRTFAAANLKHWKIMSQAFYMIQLILKLKKEDEEAARPLVFTCRGLNLQSLCL